MKAAEHSRQSWESINEERIVAVIERGIALNKQVLKRLVIGINVLAFLLYKILKFAGSILRAALLSSPIVRLEREESWIYRQIK